MSEAKQRNFWENDPEEIENENYGIPVEMTWEEAEKVAQETRSQINLQGWCLWRLRNVKGQKICLVRDYSVHNYPAEYPAFSLAELDMLPDDFPNSTLNLIIKAKILGDAVIESVEENKNGKEAN
ncbi:hypothetical protein [Dehalococcoides mccartyi]|uniref:hypothetical protein n=1 Tax=Dehalococcoides mccartyi TaxID=61435 RepID=UPI0006BC797A|nr:hypothetical protein [Dehalococcoides mccartyi]BAS31209.1 hypothetical protein IBK_0134 [Dehalococcoides mccartyi IBARAKI]